MRDLVSTARNNRSRLSAFNIKRPIDDEAVGFGRQIRILSSMQDITLFEISFYFINRASGRLRISLEIKQALENRTASLRFKLDVNMKMTSPSSRTAVLVKDSLKLGRHDAALLLAVCEELNMIVLVKSTKQLFLLISRIVHGQKPVVDLRAAFATDLIMIRIWLNSGRRNTRKRLRH